MSNEAPKQRALKPYVFKAQERWWVKLESNLPWGVDDWYAALGLVQYYYLGGRNYAGVCGAEQ